MNVNTAKRAATPMEMAAVLTAKQYGRPIPG